MKFIKAATLASLVLCSATTTIAQSSAMKPGLWSVATKMSGNAEMDRAMAEMQKQMAAMPADQRKQMEAMLAKGGMGSFNAGAGGGISTQLCFTKEMLARGDEPYRAEGECTQTRTSASGGKVRFKFQCTKPKSSGEGEFDVGSPESYGGRITVTSEERGKPQTMTINVAGKFVGANCGSVKPIDQVVKDVERALPKK
jgi:hypothetical protein